MKKFKWTLFIFIGLVGISFMGFQLVKPGNTNDAEIFRGTINHAGLNGNIFFGDITYDKNCKNVGNGLTHCDAGIKTKEYGVLNFEYIHNMSKHPCLVAGNKVLLKVKNDDNAIVIR